MSMTSLRRPVETSGPWLQPLAVLPVFLKLSGRRAVVAGGSAGAAWKALLLASCGADVEVFAPESSTEMRDAPGQTPAGSLRVLARAWTAADLSGAAIAIAAQDDPDDAARFVAAARATGVPANAVDRPELCDFQFGAIVNRSPLVVGVSTDGAAPVLGMAARSMIEGLLPHRLKLWAEAARDWREPLRARVASFASRRHFWRRFVDHALQQPQATPDPALFEALLADQPATHGRVVLVGAGPGDPELLTLKAVRALRTADVVLYDDLIAPEVLDFARREARKLLVGKTGYRPSCRQSDINAMLVDFARQGHRVVRLKGGDPLIFGRAGEEIAACRAAGIAVEIIPGVSAAQGAAAAAGVSLTERAKARSVQFITAHDMAGKLPETINWTAVADPTSTTAVYMPRAHLDGLLREAQARGLPGGTPALAVFNATRPNETQHASTVAGLAARLAGVNATGPCIVLFGAALDSPANAAPAVSQSSAA